MQGQSALSSALLTAALLAATGLTTTATALLLAFALLAFAFLFLAISLLATLLSWTAGLTRFVWITLRLRFLIEGGLEKLRGSLLSEQLSKGTDAAVTGDLIMFDFLCRDDDTSVNDGFVAFFL